MVDVNVVAQHVLFKYVLHRMESEGGGAILNVASSAGLFPAGPFMSGYYATKAYMTSLTRGVAEGTAAVGVSRLCRLSLPRPREHGIQRGGGCRFCPARYFRGGVRGFRSSHDEKKKDGHHS